MKKATTLVAAAALSLSLGTALAGHHETAKEAPKAAPEAPKAEVASAIINHSVQTIDGSSVSLSDYRGKALLIVNTASKCGFTPQYEGLQALFKTYEDKGLVVLGFPSNDFGGQEPGTAEEIKTFCKVNYGVTFPMFAKVHAIGENKAPIYQTLTEQTPEGIRGEVKWNFTKFLVGTDGAVLARFDSRVAPDNEALIQAIEAALPTKS